MLPLILPRGGYFGGQSGRIAKEGDRTKTSGVGRRAAVVVFVLLSVDCSMFGGINGWYQSRRTAFVSR